MTVEESKASRFVHMAGRRGAALLLAASVVVFVAIALDVTHHGLLARLDPRVAHWIAADLPGWVERGATVVTRLGGLAVLSALTAAGAAWLLHRGNRSDSALLILALTCVWLLTNGLKTAFDRPRPAASLAQLPHSASFPSGHASSSLVVLTLLAVLLSRRRKAPAVVVACIAAAAVGASRVLLDVHYVSDVLAGFCVGLAVVATILLLRRG